MYHVQYFPTCFNVIVCLSRTSPEWLSFGGTKQLFKWLIIKYHPVLNQFWHFELVLSDREIDKASGSTALEEMSRCCASVVHVLRHVQLIRSCTTSFNWNPALNSSVIFYYCLPINACCCRVPLIFDIAPFFLACLLSGVQTAQRRSVLSVERSAVEETFRESVEMDSFPIINNNPAHFLFRLSDVCISFVFLIGEVWLNPAPSVMWH